MAEPRETVLVVDDSDINLDLLVETLAGHCDLLVAHRGARALALAERRRPDLILLDVVMPDLDGFTVARRLAASAATRGIPIIFITSLHDEASEREGLALGAVDFVTKPFNPLLVLARVRNQLELKRHRDRLADLVALRTAELRLTQEATLASMAILAEYRDSETGAHIQRTKRYVRALARALVRRGECLPDLDLLEQSAALHDIGKVAIPDAILLKAGPLTTDEFELMKRHTFVGGDVIRRAEEIIGPSSFLALARDIAESHHERWDGTGYPAGRRGDEIPMSARIMAVADVYDALASRRSYKPALPHERAVEVLLRGDGRTSPDHFCPHVLAAFGEVVHEFAAIARRFPDR